MSTSSLLPSSLLGSIVLPILQDALDAAFGPGKFTINADSSGVSAGLTLSSGQTINVENLIVNAQGLSGRLYIDGLDSTPLTATLFSDFTVSLTAFDITLAQSGLAASHIAGSLTIPPFLNSDGTDSNGNPATIDIEISTDSKGNLTISLAAVESTQSTTPDGLIQLKYDLAGVGSIELDVASVEITETNGVWTIIFSGNLIIETEGLSWPSIELKGLGIDSKGHISLEGGWIDLPNQMALDFYGFHVGLQKLGFGTDASGDKWVGFNGDINLVEGLTLGGSVRGLQINLTHPGVTLDGVSISFEIPDVLTIDGEIDHFQVNNAMSGLDLTNAGLPGYIFDFIAPAGSTGPKSVNVFAGAVKLVISAAGDLEVDANFIVGTFGGQSVFFLDVDAELPVGIPIFLDVALYGLQGLVATGLQPAPEPTYTWWQWFKYQAAGESGGSGTTTGAVDLSSKPNYSATDFYKWLVPSPGAFAIGAGATIGTEADDGYTASAAIMFVLMLPGPVISLIGKANILSPRIGAASGDANFDAMATYDGNSQTFDLTIDAQYSIPVVLDIQATAELFVGDGQWYFALGKPPHEKRVSARIFDLFESDAYFVVSDTGLVTGTWTGYKNSWTFGPLKASLDAYLAALAAIQWAPLQIGGGIELYGNIQLSAFGIGVGITADALLEGCAPNPFWIHGELSVELDLPWPLPNVGATISLTWGGDDGSVPPAPLALGHLDATLIDHCDSAGKQASDHYLLLAHGKQAVSPDLSVDYDPVTPGILGLSAPSGRTATTPPDLIPNNTSSAQFAPVLPQDAHFTLNFSQGTCDGTGALDGALPWGSFPTLPALPALPSATLIGADDMSNININPNQQPVQFVIRHTLVEVALYQFDNGTSSWSLICSTATPTVPDPPIGVTQLSLVWLSAQTTNSNPRQAMTQLKVVPWSLLPGTDWTVQWSGSSQIQASGTTFTDQGLTFTLGAGIKTPTIGSIGFGGVASGLQFVIDGSQANPVVTIKFTQPSVLTSITALVYVADGEFEFFNAPQCSGDGSALTPQSSWQDPTSQAWTLSFSDTGTAIQELTIPITGSALLLYSIDYSTAPVKMAILPAPESFYALATVTKIEAERVGSSSFQAVPNGNPIVEFAYFQTASGPGTVQGTATTVPVPVAAAPYPQLQENCSAAGQRASASPLAGALTDLKTYTQWSWPLDGATTAYYGYDVNVEFVESYVNALYTTFSNGNVDLSLHFRCVDRNNNHTLLVPNAIHVPSIPQQSALAADAVAVPLPSYITQNPRLTNVFGTAQQASLVKRAAQAVNTNVLAEAAPVFEQVSMSALIENVNLNTRTISLGIQQISPGLASEILHEIAENNAGQQAKNLWFKPFLPSTRYTLDVVAGPLERGRDRDAAFLSASGATQGSLSSVIAASDAIGLLAALQAYFAYEDSLTSLERVQFTTSRYENFIAHLANAASQLAGAAGATPIRNYVAAADPLTWLGSQAALLNAYITTGSKYVTDHANLATLVASFDPLADDLAPGGTTITNGASALVNQRQTTAKHWSAFSQATNAIYDGLIAALGHPEMVSNTVPIVVPDTEISLFTDSSGLWVEAILIQSPEPLPWQRIWRWIRLTNSANASDPPLALWNADGTIGLLVPINQVRGVYNLSIAFQGNIGAEAPCITQNGYGVSETVPVGSIKMGPLFRRPGGIHPIPLPERPVLDIAPSLMSILHG
jgi:hypothetical protein